MSVLGESFPGGESNEKPKKPSPWADYYNELSSQDGLPSWDSLKASIVLRQLLESLFYYSRISYYSKTPLYSNQNQKPNDLEGIPYLDKLRLDIDLLYQFRAFIEKILQQVFSAQGEEIAFELYINTQGGDQDIVYNELIPILQEFIKIFNGVFYLSKIGKEVISLRILIAGEEKIKFFLQTVKDCVGNIEKQVAQIGRICATFSVWSTFLVLLNQLWEKQEKSTKLSSRKLSVKSILSRFLDSLVEESYPASEEKIEGVYIKGNVGNILDFWKTEKLHLPFSRKIFSLCEECGLTRDLELNFEDAQALYYLLVFANQKNLNQKRVETKAFTEAVKYLSGYFEQPKFANLIRKPESVDLNPISNLKETRGKIENPPIPDHYKILVLANYLGFFGSKSF